MTNHDAILFTLTYLTERLQSGWIESTTLRTQSDHIRRASRPKWLRWSVWPMSLAGFYMAMLELEEMELVESKWGDATSARGWNRSRLYKLTPKSLAGEKRG